MVVHQFENTPKAFANFSPGLEHSDNPGIANNKTDPTLKGFVLRGTLSGFNASFLISPRVVAALQPRAEISERLRRIFKLNPYLFKLNLYLKIELLDLEPVIQKGGGVGEVTRRLARQREAKKVYVRLRRDLFKNGLVMA